MKRTTLPILALLLAPAAAFATPVAIDWTGQIDSYGATPGSPYPQTLSTNSVSGEFTLDTALLPPPDSGNPPGVLSFSGSGYLQSSVNWNGGLVFHPEPPGSSGSNSLYLNLLGNECLITDSSTYTDSSGAQHEAVVSLDITHFVQLLWGGDTTGSGVFADATTDGSTGFGAVFSADSITTHVLAAPEIDPASGLSALTLLAGALAIARGRRQKT